MTDDPHVFDTYETLYADGRFSTGGTVTADRATLPFAGHASGDGSVLQGAGFAVAEPATGVPCWETDDPILVAAFRASFGDLPPTKVRADVGSRTAAFGASVHRRAEQRSVGSPGP